MVASRQHLLLLKNKTANTQEVNSAGGTCQQPTEGAPKKKKKKKEGKSVGCFLGLFF
jgi:hypothetical protein